MKLYEVGGSIRRKLIGLEPNDIDYAVEGSTFEELKEYLLLNNYKIVEEKPHEFRIKAALRAELDLKGKVEAVDGKLLPANTTGPFIDFVLCNANGKTKGVTIDQDLKRRDFQVNAMAIDLETGLLIDPHNGEYGCKSRRLRLISIPAVTFKSPIRILRAIRLTVTEGFELVDNLKRGCVTWGHRLAEEEPNKIVTELNKCFNADPVLTLKYLNEFGLAEVLFNQGLKLKVGTNNKLVNAKTTF